MSISGAAASGDKLKLLYAMRDRVAEALEDCPTRDLSPLTRRLQDIVKDIDEVEEQIKQEGRGLDGGTDSGWNPTEEL